MIEGFELAIWPSRTRRPTAPATAQQQKQDAFGGEIGQIGEQSQVVCCILCECTSFMALIYTFAKDS